VQAREAAAGRELLVSHRVDEDHGAGGDGRRGRREAGDRPHGRRPSSLLWRQRRRRHHGRRRRRAVLAAAGGSDLVVPRRSGAPGRGRVAGYQRAVAAPGNLRGAQG